MSSRSRALRVVVRSLAAVGFLALMGHSRVDKPEEWDDLYRFFRS